MAGKQTHHLKQGETMPLIPSSLVGRQAEIRAITGALKAGRLITLIGTGGCGKTRLALEIAHSTARRFPAGRWWVDLNPVTDPRLVPQTVKTAFGTQVQNDETPLQAIQSVIGSQRCLLVLDNCEHLLTAAASLAYSLLRACPQLKILATSLIPLGLPNEQVMPILPLEVPLSGSLDKQDYKNYTSLVLFTERAQAANPRFSLNHEKVDMVASICRRLEGIPLAIELAAPLTAVLSLEQIDAHLAISMDILTRMEKPALGILPPRHRTLRATLEWGYGLLTQSEQRLLRRLSILPGLFTLEIIEALGSGADERHELIASLSGLVGKSMVIAVELPAKGPARYRMLEPVRQFAREKLETSGEAHQARDQHLRWALELVEQAEPMLLGKNAAQAVQSLDSALEGLRAAMRWAITTHQVETGMRLVGGLFRYWFMRGSMDEGRAWAEELLNLPDEDSTVSPNLRARAAYVSGRLACRQGDQQAAGLRGKESLRLAQEVGDRKSEARALDLLGLVAHELNDFETAAAHHQAALSIRRDLGDDYEISVSLNNLGILYFDRAEFDQAAKCFEEAFHTAHNVGVALLAAHSNLAEIALLQGKTDRALLLAQEGLKLAEESADRHATAGYLRVLGVTARLQGDLEEAERYTKQAAQIYREQKTPWWLLEIYGDLGELAVQRGSFDQAEKAYSTGIESCRSANLKTGLARLAARRALLRGLGGDGKRAFQDIQEAVEGLKSPAPPLIMAHIWEAAAAGLAQKNAAQASVFLAAASAQLQSLGLPRLPPWRERIEHLEESLGEKTARPLPRSLTLEEAWRLIQQAYQQAEISQVHLIEAGPEQIGPLPSLELQAYALGPTRVLVGGQEVKESAWTYRKARELLFYLLDHTKATKSQIGLDLWPDASAEQLRNYFHRSLYFLRRALGDGDWMVYDGRMYSLNRDLPLSYDVHEFEAALRQAAELGAAFSITSEQRQEMRNLLQHAIQRWRGEFLQDLDAGEWAILRREQLRLAYLRALLDLGQVHFLEGDYAAAQDAYLTVLKEDPYLELAHREWMRCLTRQGESAQATQHYQKLKSLLADELKAAPSYETTLLYERIRRGDDV